VRRAAAALAAILLAACAIPEPPRRSAPAIREGARLELALPRRSDLVREGSHWYWTGSSGARFELLRALRGEWLELATPRGPLRAHWELLADDSPDPLRDLPALLGHAERAGLALDGVTLRSAPLLGLHLRAGSIRVIREGVLREADASGLAARSAVEREAAAKRLDLAIAEADGSLAAARLSTPARTALGEILAQLRRAESDVSFDHVPPGFARRMLRSGWPGERVIPARKLEALRSAVQGAEAYRPEQEFSSEAGSLRRARNALGGELWLLRTPERSAYARRAGMPAYFYELPVHTLVVSLRAGADPLGEAAQWTGAAVFASGRRIAYWSEGKLHADPARWREAYPLGGPGADPGQLPDALPPHIAVLEPDGDLLALLTAYGELRPATGGKPAQAERFYRDAARVLPDAAHLDLLGQHFLVYTYDSPDTRHPELIGTRQLAGDIHQTASQTLDTLAGGMYRGDCDDLSELYLEVARRQGRNAHMIGLPAHAALAWSEPSAEGWRTWVLQTGQPRMFAAATLRESLEQAYRSFGTGDVLDFTKLEVLLRFSGENTRQSWYLSERIFSDPGYARAMIDIQQDWHFQTYQRAIEKVQRMIDAGDTDPANYSELAGLYHYTGRYSEAADALERALAQVESGQTRVSLAIDRMLALFRAGRRDEGRALALELRELQIPALERELGRALADPRLTLADALLDPRADADLAVSILADDVAALLDPVVAEIAGQLADGDELVKLWNDGAVDPVRYQLRWFASSAVNALYRTRSGPLARHPAREALIASARLWIDGVGFHDFDPTESVLARFALVGRFYRVLGQPADLDARLARAGPPPDGQADLGARVADDEQVERDIPWIASSPTFWASELAEEFAEQAPRAEPARVAELSQRVLAARRRARELGLDHAEFDASERAAHLLRALLGRREAELRAVMREVRAGNDRRERLELASWIAAAARSLPLDWYGRVLGIFREELNYKPTYFWIAWTAALSGAEPQGLLTARFAARQFPRDADFAAEYAYMRTRFGRGRAAH
jgi:tetratricopeptide (TPR) repeat protein